MNLNKQKREAICKAAVKKVYAEQYEALRKEARETFSRIYADVHAIEIRLAKKLPDNWINKSERLIVRLKDGDGNEALIEREFSPQIEPQMVNRPVSFQSLDKQYPCHRTYSQPKMAIERDSNYGREILDLQKRQRGLIKEIGRFHDEVASVLASCRTHKQLETTAPELYALIPDEMKSAPRQNVVAIETVEEVSNKLRAAAGGKRY